MNRVTSELSEWLPAVESIAVEAGQLILSIYRGAFNVSHKADASPLTEADLQAHRRIAAGLTALTPDLPQLSEEGADIPYPVRAKWTRYWLIDPLDGTKEFVKRNDEFSVNIALIDHGHPILGVVHGPAIGVTYAAAAGIGAFRRQGGRRAPISTRRWPVTPEVLASRSHGNLRVDALMHDLPDHRSRPYGSALKFGLIAAGEADFYPRLGPTSEWDTAAGQCIVEAAGGAMLRCADQQPLRYNTGPGLLNPDFWVLGDRHALANIPALASALNRHIE